VADQACISCLSCYEYWRLVEQGNVPLGDDDEDDDDDDE
jgi:hypothetical protein